MANSVQLKGLVAQNTWANAVRILEEHIDRRVIDIAVAQLQGPAFNRAKTSTQNMSDLVAYALVDKVVLIAKQQGSRRSYGSTSDESDSASSGSRSSEEARRKSHSSKKGERRPLLSSLDTQVTSIDDLVRKGPKSSFFCCCSAVED